VCLMDSSWRDFRDERREFNVMGTTVLCLMDYFSHVNPFVKQYNLCLKFPGFSGVQSDGRLLSGEILMITV
jgi:hypothetical protein